MFTKQELQDAIALCTKQLNELGYELPYIHYETSNRMSRALGKCQWIYSRSTKKVTNITIKLSNDLTPKIMPNTLMHEMIHAIYPLDKHGGRFKMLANKVNKAFGYHVETYASGESLETIKAVRRAKMVEIECVGCGLKSLIKPNTKLYVNVMSGLCTCNKCKGKDFKKV